MLAETMEPFHSTYTIVDKARATIPTTRLVLHPCDAIFGNPYIIGRLRSVTTKQHHYISTPVIVQIQSIHRMAEADVPASPHM